VLEARPDLRHALINLLSNAADASLAAGSHAIELRVAANAARVEFGVLDHGNGSDIGPGSGTAFQTSKRDGLGLGLALAHATAERLGGELNAQAVAGGGLLQRLHVPLAAADNRSP
jgi:two-component system sensor histidine kinase RegB